MMMYKLKSLLVLLAVAGLTTFSGCDSDNEPEPIPPKTGVLIVNEGNFGSGNGSVSFYDEELQTISNNVVKSANSGNEIGATVQSIYLFDGVGYIICNGPDKIEFISETDYKYLDNPITDISQPRYMTAMGNKGYISCWGPWGANYSLPDSYIAVVDLATFKVVDSLECGSGPEGIIALDNKLYVANSYETTVSVIDLIDNSAETVTFDAAPNHFVSDENGNLWVSLSAGWMYPADKSGIQLIDLSTNSKGTFVAVPDVNGPIAIGAMGQNIYLLTAEAYPETGTKIEVYNTIDKSLATTTLISGENFYGLGYNLTTDKIYIADSKAFGGPGEFSVYGSDGTLIDTQTASIGPNGFTFK